MSVIVDMQDKLIGAADKPLWQYDYGQTVTIQNVDIPDKRAVKEGGMSYEKMG